MAEIITDETGAAFVETKCIFEHDNVKFESGGSFLTQRKDTGKREGMLYRLKRYPTYKENFGHPFTLSRCSGVVGSWDDSLRIRAYFSASWRSNFGDIRQSVYFKYQDKCYHGIWYTNSDIIRCWEMKPENFSRQADWMLA